MNNSQPIPILIAVPRAALRRRFGCVTAIATLAWTCGFLGGQALALRAAETVAQTAVQPPIAFRRVFVPADPVETWPRDHEKYIPIESRDFENAIQAANDAATANSSSASIDVAEYTASLDDAGQFHGAAKWTVTLRGAEPAFLPLAHFSLAIDNAHWQNTPQQSARLGTWGVTGGKADRIALEVPASGILEFNWAAQSKRDGDKVEIPWQLPASASTKFLLDLPDGAEPIVDGGAVLESKLLPVSPTTPAKPRRRWVLASGPSAMLAIRIAPDAHDATSTKSQLTVSDNTHYRIQQGGLEMNSEWKLEGSFAQQQQLSVPLTRGGQLTSVAAGDQELSWRVVPGPAASTDRALIILPASADRRQTNLKLAGWFPLVVDRPWKLPVLRPDESVWNSGKLEISVTPQFELRNLNTIDCTQTGVKNTGAGTTEDEIFTLSPYSPSATLEVTVGRRLPRATVRIGSSLVLSDPDVTGRLVTVWAIDRGNLHQISGEIAAGWNIETVETIPSDAMSNWFVDRRGNHRQLEIQLTNGVTSQHNVSVVVMGRLQHFSLASPIASDTLRMINWSAANVERSILSFQTARPFTIEPVGELPTLSPDAVSDADRKLLDQAVTSGRIVDLTHARSDAGLQLSFKRGEYEAEISLDLDHVGNELRQTNRITVRPHDSSVDRLLIYATAPLGGTTKWTDVSSGSPLQAERLSADDPQMKNLPRDGELWMVRLQQPTTKTIEVSAVTTLQLSKRESPPLLSLPEASEQSGHAVVRAAAPLLIEPAGLSPTALPTENPPAQSETSSVARAAFRYNPSECLSSERVPRLWISSGESNKSPSLVCRDVAIESFYWPDGRSNHCGRFSLVNCGPTEFIPPLPADAQISSVLIDGQPVGQSVPEAGRAIAPIRLPGQTSSVVVTVFYDMLGASLAAGAEVMPPLQTNDTPLLAGEWKVWLPAEYQSVVGTQIAAAGLDWRYRLFGPLARTTGTTPFNPLRVGDWARLVNGFAVWQFATTTTPTRFDSVEPSQPNFDSQSVEPVDPSAKAVGSRYQQPSNTSTGFRGTSREIPGWTAYRQTFVGDGDPTSVVIQHPTATAAWSIVVLLGTFVLGTWFCRRLGRLLVVGLAMSAILALLLPITFAPLATGGMWGFLLSALAEWPRRLLTPPYVHDAGRPRTSVAVVALVLLAVAWTSPIRAQLSDAPIAAAEGPPKIERVLIPVDSDRRPTGTKYFVSEKFLRELLAVSPDLAANRNNWLLIDSNYNGELVQDRERSDTVAGNWTITLSMETLSRDTTVILPLVRDEADWSPTAMLDGVPLPLKWLDSGGCSIEIEQPGRYSLTLSCIPKTAVRSGRNQIGLTIPPLLSANLELHAPVELTEIRAGGKSRAAFDKAASGKFSCDLSQLDRLVVDWPRPETKNGIGQALAVTAMSWLNVGEAETELETKFIVEGSAHRPDNLSISYDEHWIPLSGVEPQPEGKKIDNTTGRRVLTVPLPKNDADHTAVRVRWKLSPGTSLGNLRVPPVELVAIPATQRWFALSFDPTLDCSINENAASVSSPKEFLAKWGEASVENVPQLVLDNFDPSRVWTVAIRPLASEPTVHETLQLAIGEQAVRVAYQASVTPSKQPLYQCHVTLPANMSVADVTLTSADRTIPTRWIRNSDNQLNVFFGEAAASDYRILITGNIPLSGGGPFAIPRITSAAPAAASQQLQLYREDEVHVDLKSFPAADESKSETTELAPIQWLVRPLGVFHLGESKTEAASFTVKSAKPKLVGDTLTTLSRESGTWSAAYHCQLNVQSGDLDSLRLRVPASWSGPYQVDSNVPATVETTPIDEMSRNIVVRFATTVSKGGRVDVKIRAPLATSTSSNIAFPGISPEPAIDGHRYGLVPRTLDAQPISWNEAGVREAVIPQNLLQSSSDLAKLRPFEIVDDSFHVVERAQSGSLPAPRVRLVDTAISAGEHGGQLVATRFVISSDGLPNCTLRLPNDQRLIAIMLNGRPALAAALDATHWHVTLGPPQLPQCLEIVSQSTGAALTGPPEELRRPALFAGDKPLPVEVSLWSFSQPGRTVPSTDQAAAVSAIDQAALRFDRMVSIAESSTKAAQEVAESDRENWRRPWSELLKDVRERALHLGALTAAEPTAPQVARASEELIGRASDRLDKWLQDPGESASTPVPPESTSTPRAGDLRMYFPESLDQRSSVYFVSDGGSDRLALSIDPSTSWYGKSAGLIAIVTLAAASIWLMRSPIGMDFVCRWPHAFGILIGLAYWAWLSPSWLGLLIAAAALWHSLRFDWPGRSLRAEASTVLRSTRAHQNN